MSSIEYINALAARGIKLWAQSGKLQYEAPKEAVTPELIAELKEYKAALVPLLEQFAGTAGVYPLSYSQKSLWALHQLNPHSAAYNVLYAARLVDDLDMAALARCVDYLIARHPILRTRYFVIDGQPQQQVSSEASARLAVEKVFGAGEEAIREWIDREANRPFDLGVSPIRLKLLVNTLGDSSAAAPRHALLLNVHHIAADFWSLEIMVRELRALYRLALEGQPLKLAPLPLLYKDCVQHEADRLQGPAGPALAAFWQDELRGGLPTLALATARPRPPVKTEHGKVFELAVGEAVSRSVRNAAKAQRVTPYMLLLSVYQLLLFLHTGQSRLLIGAPTAGRSTPGSDQVLGHFVNTVVLACELQAGDRFDELVARTRSMVLRVLDHPDYPFPLLVEKMRPPRDPSRSPVFQVMYNWNQLRADADTGAATLFGPTLAASSTGTRGATHDLTLNIQDDGQQYVAAWTFNTDLFDEASVARFAAQYMSLLQQALAEPSRLLADHRLTSTSVRAEMFERMADAARNAAPRSPLPAAFAAHAQRHPRQTAWQLGRHTWSYADVADAVRRVTARLRAHGVAEGAVAALQLSSAVERAVALLALLELNVALSTADATDAGAVPTDTAPTGLDAVVRGGSGEWAAWDPGALTIAKPSASERGLGQGTATSAAQIGRFIDGMGRLLALDDTSRVLVPSGTDLQLASSVLVAAVAAGGVVCAPDECSLAALADADGVRADVAALALETFISTAEITALAVPDLLLPALADCGLERLNALVAYGGHPHAVERLQRCERVPAAVCFVPAFCVATWAGPVALHHTASGWHLAMSGSLYPMPLVLGPFNDLTDEHQAGRLHLIVDRSADSQRDRVAVPGRSDLDGARIHHRVVETPLLLTRRGGEWVCPHPSWRVAAHRFAPFAVGPVESCIAAQPGVHEVACLVRDMPQGPVFVAYVCVGEEFDRERSEAELRRCLKQALPEFEHPQAIVWLERLPLAGDGRLDETRLPLPQPRVDTRAAANEVERKLAAIWCEVLSLPAVGMSDDFFALGGDSILAAVIVSKAGLEGLYIQPKDLFEYTTIEGLAQVVTATPQIQAEQGAVAGETVPGPAAAWFFEHIDIDRSHFNQALLVSLQEAPDATLMQETLRLLARQHDVLRSHFTQQDGRWRQVFDDAVALPDCETVSCTDAEGRTSAALWREAIAAAQSGLDIERGPLWRLRWLAGASLAESRLLIVVHHLLIDGMSWSVLLQDLSDIYLRLRSHAAPALPLKTSSAKAWVEGWMARASSEAMAAERSYWLDFGARLEQVLSGESVALMHHRRLHVVPKQSDDAPGSCAIVLDEALTTAFRTTAHQAYGTDANDLLLAALHAGFHAWGASQALLLDLEGHGRDALAESVDLSRSIGWFTSIYPVLLQAPNVADPAGLIKSVKEQLREIPNKGAGFGVLRHLEGGADAETRRVLTALPASPVLFTYLGTLDAMTGVSAFYTGEVEPAPGIRSPRQRRTHLLDVCAYVNQGRLTVECTFDGAAAVEESISRLMGFVQDALTALIRHCCSEDAGGLTPSDVPELDLDQQGLDTLLEEVAALER